MSLATVPVGKVKGVGPALLEKLHQLKIESVKDLLEYFPYRYDSFELIDIHRAMHEEKITVLGKVMTACQVQYYGKMKSRLTFNILVNHEVVKVVVFKTRSTRYRYRKMGSWKKSHYSNRYKNGNCRWTKN